MQAKSIKGIIVLLTVLGLFLFLYMPNPSTQNTTKIGIIIPIEQQALTDIVNGFEYKLKKLYPGKLTFVVQNAQGDINIQHSIIQSFNMDPSIKLVVPVGTTTTEMAMKLIKNKPILAIAAEITEQQRQNSPNKNMTALIDEFPPEKTLQLIQAVQPQLRNLTVIYSSDPKIYQTITKLEQVIKKKHLNIKLQKLLITQLPDLYTVTQRISKNSQAVLVFKDSLIVSGINTLSKKVDDLHIPLITSDQESVVNGASFALGVSERQIGIEAAPLAKAILTGHSAADMPMIHMKKPRVFYNQQALTSGRINLKNLQLSAKHLNYQLQDTKTHG